MNMNELSFESSLRWVIAGLGAVAVATGLLALVLGANALPGEEAASPTTESALRFYAVFWIAFGLVAMRVAPNAGRETLIVRALAAAMFCGGVARALAWADVGRPHAFFVALTIAELIGGPLLVLWQAKAAERQAAFRSA